uniref:Uncharacterized protein n=1 Tax=Tetranychus urticae TaxID=32264 RepID=T1JRQ6_TETUR
MLSKNVDSLMFNGMTWLQFINITIIVIIQSSFSSFSSFLLFFRIFISVHLKKAFPMDRESKQIDKKLLFIMLINKIMGISVQNICRCKNFNSCPDQFDRYDGRTIVHGIGQYKYCEEAPRLRPCSSHDIALVITSESNLETETTDYKLQCLCPKNNIFVLNSTHLRDVDGLTIDAFLFNCKSPEICGFRQPCMTITQTPYTYFEKKVCNCPMDSFCPTDLRYAYQSTISQFNRGSAFYMHCI